MVAALSCDTVWTGARLVPMTDPAPAVAPTLRSVLEAALKFAISGESA
jgi:hypothetical protein